MTNPHKDLLMRALDVALLKELAQGGNPAIVGGVSTELTRQLPAARIDTPLRMAHFLAQGLYETLCLRRLAENLNYSAARIGKVWPRLASRAALLADNPEALANAAYASRNGNGDEASGDGWRFRGRGLFMLTGRNNYASAAALEYPDRLETPEFAVSSAITFWNGLDMNEVADADDISRVTLLVNGAEEGIAERMRLKQRALRLLTKTS
jgi:putative chitinase